MLSIKPSLSSTAITDLTQWPRRELSPADHRVSRQELRGWAPKRHGASCACVRFFQYRRVPERRQRSSRSFHQLRSPFPELLPGDIKGQKFQTREKSLPRAQRRSPAVACAPVTVLGFMHARTPHPTGDVHKAASRPQAAEVHGRQDPTLPRASYRPRRRASRAKRRSACAPRAGRGALWEARAFCRFRFYGGAVVRARDPGARGGCGTQSGRGNGDPGSEVAQRSAAETVLPDPGPERR